VIQLERGGKKPILIAFLLAITVGGIGGAVTEIGPWYFSLIKPTWQPPDWAFGPIWTLIYITTGIAGVRAWRLGDARQRRLFLIALLINCALNVLWSLLFFKMQRPDLSLIEVVALWLSIVPLILLPLRYSPRSSLLILPYLAWVSVAAYLNLTIVRLNPIL
jgi:tryptophan-rich sensory protein